VQNPCKKGTYVPMTQWNQICALEPTVISKSVAFAFAFDLTPESRPPDLEERRSKDNHPRVLLWTFTWRCKVDRMSIR